MSSRGYVCLRRSDEGDELPDLEGWLLSPLAGRCVAIWVVDDFRFDGIAVVDGRSVMGTEEAWQSPVLAARQTICEAMGVVPSGDAGHERLAAVFSTGFGSVVEWAVGQECFESRLLMVENEIDDDVIFGEPLLAGMSSIWVRGFDAAGIWDEEVTEIPLESISLIKVQDPYVAAYAHVLDNQPPLTESQWESLRTDAPPGRRLRKPGSD